MKKSILTIALCCAATGLFAQNADDLARLAEEGQDAFLSRKWREAYAKWNTYMEQTNYRDSVIAYNCGFCANRIGKSAEAVKYFDIAIQKKYNSADAYVGKAKALKSMKKYEEFDATIKEGLEADPGNKRLAEIYTDHYNIQAGLYFWMTGGKTDGAIESLKKTLAFQEDNVRALHDLAFFYHMNGNAALETDPGKAEEEFRKAKEYLEKLMPLLSPDDPQHVKWMEDAKRMLASIPSTVN